MFTTFSSRPPSRQASYYGSAVNSTNPSRANSLSGPTRNHSLSGPTPAGPSRNPSAFSLPKTTASFTDHTTAAATPDNLSEKGSDSDGVYEIGRIVGGKHHLGADENQPHPDHGPLTVVDIDLPLTLTELIRENGKEYIVLAFAEGDGVNPFNWGVWYKFCITSILCCMTLFIGLATTSYSSGIGGMVEELGATEIEGQLGLFLFNISCAVAPMVLAPFCEMVGRRVVYAGAFFCFSLLFIGLALGRNIETILICRLLLGLFGCVGTILVGGTFDDMYEPQHRSRPMALFAFIAIFGTVAAPIYAGFIDQALGWRWVQGIQGLANVPLLIIVILFFPETRGGVFLQKRAKALRKATGDDRYVAADDIHTPTLKAMLKASSVKAINMLATEPVVFFMGLWIGFCWFLVFLFLSVIPITYTEKRGWGEGVSGLPYISLAIGTTLGWLAHHIQMRRYDRLTQDPNRPITPEDRLWGATWGAIWLPIGLFIFTFTQYEFLSWVGPTVGLAPIAFGIYFVFESVYSYTADCYGPSASSAIAGQGLMRNTLGAITPLFASAFFHNLGSQYAGLILSIAGTVLSAIPFVAIKYGPGLRARSRLAMRY